jgi:hypothetical protein
MSIPFTVKQFYGVFREYNGAVWPAQVVLVGLALAAVALALKPQRWSGVGVSAILGLLWAWIAVNYHYAFFARTSPPAFAFALVSMAGAVLFVWQGVIRRLLERAGTSSGVRMLLMTERRTMERVLDHVVQDNMAQMADPAFVKELKTWIRFNGTDAVRTRDGLFSVASGNPAIPTWLGDLGFGRFFTTQGENDKFARQSRSSAGIAVFVGEIADKAHWVEVGRSYERFALQATALGIRNAFLNQPVEVPSVRSPFADAVGLAGQRPDLMVHFGRGPSMPRSLRRPVQAVPV